MQTRRGVVASVAGAFALLGCGPSAWAEGNDEPSAKLTSDKPPLLDYGGDLKVPCTKDAFFTLWEGGTFWLTFGFGISPSVDIAKIRATKQAVGVMKFMLLTLAFAPQRLVKSDSSGWRKKDPAAHDFVLGELDLPVHPSKSMSDAFLGLGNTEISPFWNWGNNGAPFESSSRNNMPAQSGPPSNLRPSDQHAFSSQIVMKKDLSLDDVRKRASILQL